MVHHLATAFVDFLLAFSALFSQRAPAAKPMALLAMSMGFWSLELFFLGTLHSSVLLDNIFHITRWGLFMIPPSFALLTWYVTGKNSREFLTYIIIPLFVFAVGLCITNFFIFPSELEEAIGGYQPVNDVIYYSFALSFAFSMLSSIVIACLSFKHSTYRDKARIKWLLIVLVCIFFLGFSGILLAGYPFYLKFVGAAINILSIGLLFYASVQHNLMDLRLAFGVGVVKISSVAVIIWIYTFFVTTSLEVEISSSHIIVMAIFVYLILDFYPRFSDWMLTKTKKMVTTAAYDDRLLRQNARLMLEASFDHMAFNRVLYYIFTENINIADYCCLTPSEDRKILKYEPLLSSKFFDIATQHEINDALVSLTPESNTFFLADESEESMRKALEKNGFFGFFAVYYNHQQQAVFLLGKPKNGVDYGYQDIVILDWLTTELGITFERLQQVGVLNESLHNANKTLSLLDLMNHYHHEIKAPLSIIDGIVTNNVYDNAKQREVILQQVARISKLITTMASVFKGQRQRKEQAVSLVELVKNCATLFEGQINQINYDTVDLPRIYGDKEDLTILFINLIKNAVEAAQDSDSVILSISSWIESDRLCLSITDNGAGIPAEYTSTLFEHVRTTKPGGSGVGLQAIKRIADEHRAEIHVESDGQSGSTFTLRFPAFASSYAAAS